MDTAPQDGQISWEVVLILVMCWIESERQPWHALRYGFSPKSSAEGFGSGSVTCPSEDEHEVTAKAIKTPATMIKSFFTT